MSWKVEYGDALYRIIAPNGEEGRPVHYCYPASIEYEGRVYICYMNGDEADEETSPVYDVTDWPNMVAMPTESDAVQFEAEDGAEEEVECETCNGDGFYFRPATGLIGEGDGSAV